MGNLSAPFDSSEFVCSCCGKSITMSSLLIERLEKLHSLMGAKAVYINSGYRCNNNPCGSPTDAHRKGMAADIRVQHQDGSYYTAEDIAEAAERIGFKGIGIIEPDSCHVDTRGDEPYIYDWWHGNETTGVDWTKDSGHTFIRGTVFDGESPQDPAQDHTKEELLQELKALIDKYSI